MDKSVQAWPVDNGNVLVTATTGVAFVEVRHPGDETCHVWKEYGDGNGRGPLQRQVLLTEADVKGWLPESSKGKKIKLTIHSFGGEAHNIEDYDVLMSKASTLKLSNGQLAFRGAKLGLSKTAGSQPEEIIFESAVKQTKMLMQVKVYHGLALDGIEFVYEDTTTQLFGKRGGKTGGSEFNLGKTAAA